MPAYNSERYVADAIASILAQTWTDFELIIVDDGSTDRTPEIIREFAGSDARIRTLFLDHQGQGQALNAGISLARGAFIAYVEHDDVSVRERFAIQHHWMQQHEVDVCGGCLKAFGGQSNIYWFPETHQAICHQLLFRIAMLQGATMVRADVARQHPFAADTLALDYEMLTRLAHHYRLGNVQQVIMKYRRHPEQVHVVEDTRFRAEVGAWRRRYAQALFPEANDADRAALEALAVQQPFDELAALELAGRWLLRLAQTPDIFLAQIMAQRWRKSCQRSGQLGPACYQLYLSLAPAFGALTEKDADKVRSACLSTSV